MDREIQASKRGVSGYVIYDSEGNRERLWDC
jgi:hypothetical protein